jgi:hypothetical protein
MAEKIEIEEAARYKGPLLIDRIACRLGFDWFARRLPIEVPPAYVFVTTVLGIQIGIIAPFNYFVADKVSIANDPLSILVPIGLTIAVVGIHWMQDSYAEAIVSLRLPDQETDANQRSTLFEEIIPFRAKLIAWAIGLAIFYLNLFVLLGVSTAIEIEGIVQTLFANAIVVPLVSMPLITEFAMLYVGIHVLMPRRIAKADLDLFFYDPRDMGGFAKIGQLLKRSYYLYTTGLLLYFSLTYGPTIFNDILYTPYPEPTAPVAAIFTLLWFTGVISIAYSMYRVHVVMASKKVQRINEIEQELRDLLDDPYDINSSNLANHSKREEIQHRLEQVRSTREYPSTFTMWTQIAISVILPQALNLAIQAAA